ncbi:MAG: cysteine synthase A [Pseudanabaena sp.]|jgi:cysteine synthase A|nr:cysteine synthase A [Pseudanabaena sp. M051S1SP1A06QC]MCA6595035.1 cysteine synthase A [Pseudanabaena sp. M046S1SP1A06QC]MCA6603361.1 cysteine synthase A [Pseudanabaena sp. M007S1SP1A06QC]MCA6613952.1 cysteine synthase A [Pseudanabaena sp. M090S1SP1A06QC]MCA6621107.1 cysteine synthase A [Pseudanabaena sp. M165S2SP1A06QC]MCE2976696.1 cysteine synthase A [Pseudanabaena sp. CoA8_M7]
MIRDIRIGFANSVGNTPLIEIESLSAATGCTILGKAEFLNPGGSVKDRAALFMVLEAEKSGLLKAGGTIVEGTAGNTGIGLSLVANARGYRSVIVMPSNQSQEKIDLLRTLGAEVELTNPAPFTNPDNYYHVARRRAEEIENAFWANQFENMSNSDAHYQTTAPEIWRQTGGELDGIVMSSGTGGTIGGVTAYLKEQNPQIATYLIDPTGSGLYSYITTGEFKAEGNSITEGIGINRATANFNRARLDGAFRGTDQQVIEMAQYLLKHDGLFVGSSAALNVVGAVKLAQKLGKGHTIATILCDGGGRYQSRMYNPEWLAEKGLTPLARGLEFIDD